MEDRISSLESFSQMHLAMTRIINEHMNLVDDRLRQFEEWQRQAEEWQRRSDESRRERDALLQQLLQAVTLLQADIVRIDETRS